MAEYIDRGKLVEFLKQVRRDLPHDSDEMILNLQQFVESKSFVPSEDVEPVKRGVWELDYDRNFHRCSNCKESSIRYTDEWGYEIGEELTNFCPECGAKMRGIQK